MNWEHPLQDLDAALDSTERVDPVLVSLARAVVSARLTGTPTATPEGPSQAAVIDFVELFVIDPHSVSDDIAQAVVDQLGEAGAAALTTIVAVEEAHQRARITLEAL